MPTYGSASLNEINENPQPSLELNTKTQLNCEEIEQIASSGQSQITFADESFLAMDRAKEALTAVLERGEEVYGVTTGFGPFVKYESGNGGDARHGLGLIDHLGAGYGKPMPREVVRGAMLIRAAGLAKGFSGIDRPAAQCWLDLLNSGLWPRVPEFGSVGASGDLCPLSHIAQLLIGEGAVVSESDHRVIPSKRELNRCGLDPIELTGRDALALVNGTAVMSAYTSLAIARTHRLLEEAHRFVGATFAILGCRKACLDPRLHEARGHQGQVKSAERIASYATSLAQGMQCREQTPTRPLQEVYSLRCSPQFLGACDDLLQQARQFVEQEIAGVSDNPVVIADAAGDPEGHAVLHGGNFQGQQIAFAADAISSALTELAVYADRLLATLLNPSMNDGAPLLLSSDPGPQSGLAGLQLTVTSLVAEMRRQNHPAANLSIPTNGDNQDIVSMGTTVARASYELTEIAAAVVASLGMALTQLDHLRREGKAAGRFGLSLSGFEAFEPLNQDRPLHDDLQRMAKLLLKSETAEQAFDQHVA